MMTSNGVGNMFDDGFKGAEDHKDNQERISWVRRTKLQHRSSLDERDVDKLRPLLLGIGLDSKRIAEYPGVPL